MGEDFVHYAGGEDDFPIRDRWWTARADAIVKALNEFLHSEVLVKSLPNFVTEKRESGLFVKRVR